MFFEEQMNYNSIFIIAHIKSEKSTEIMNKYFNNNDLKTISSPNKVTKKLSRAFLRYIIVKYYNGNGIEFYKDKNGALMTNLKYCISNSDSHEMIFVAASKSANLSVDIEYMVNRNFDGIAEIQFSPIEQRILKNTNNPQNKKEIFYKIWTIREVLAKFHKTGLLSPLEDDNVLNLPIQYQKQLIGNLNIKSFQLFDEYYASSLSN